MLSVYVPSESSLKKVAVTDLAALPETAVWIDLVKPTMEEDHAVERLAGIAVPTREDMQEIEISSRLYIENSARYMTATLMCHSDTDMPRTTAVTFILAGHRLVTVRTTRQSRLRWWRTSWRGPACRLYQAKWC
jgi:Mg2+ and Co2+ transporters